MKELLEQTAEYQHWGTNIDTFSFLAIMFFTLVQGWSLFEQNATIRRNRSGESLSTNFFIYSGCYFTTFFVYGIMRNSVAMTFNGLLAIPYIPIVLALYRLKSFSGSNWYMLAFASQMITAMFILHNGQQDTFILIGLFGCLLPLAGQVREMYKTKRPGSVEPKFILAFMVSGIFWFVFGLTSGNWIFVVFNPVSFTILGVAFVLYRRYKKFQTANA